MYTDLEGARRLVDAGLADSTDFWMVAGYAGWGHGQLMQELQRDSWICIQTDSRTLLNDVLQTNRQRDDCHRGFDDPRGAGISTWETLMAMIGKKEEGLETRDDFDDLMLKAWTTDRLMMAQKYAEVTEPILPEDTEASFNILDQIIRSATQTSFSIGRNDNTYNSSEEVDGAVPVGTMVRASSHLYSSPTFLLSDQEFHKSIILIVQENQDYTMGVLLNHPTTKYIPFVKNELHIPERYGGNLGKEQNHDKDWETVQYDDKDSPFLCLHSNQQLRNQNIGTPLNRDNIDGIWKCTRREMSEAIQNGLVSKVTGENAHYARKDDFMIVRNFLIWEKSTTRGTRGGMMEQIQNGHFEKVNSDAVQHVWDLLLSQKVLSSLSLDWNLMIADAAWNAACCGGDEMPFKESFTSNTMKQAMNSPQERSDVKLKSDEHTQSHQQQRYNDAPCVFDSDTKLSTLSDDALRCWVAAAILKEPLTRSRNTEFG